MGLDGPQSKSGIMEKIKVSLQKYKISVNACILLAEKTGTD
jgi:hypothetical protein